MKDNYKGRIQTFMTEGKFNEITWLDKERQKFYEGMQEDFQNRFDREHEFIMNMYSENRFGLEEKKDEEK